VYRALNIPDFKESSSIGKQVCTFDTKEFQNVEIIIYKKHISLASNLTPIEQSKKDC
jgi:hypothetical protein